MATTKKTTTKKTTAVRKTAPKKTAVASKKTAVVSKKAAPRKTTTKRAPAKSAEVRSFKVSKNNPPFTSFQITRQTVYWIILVSFIIFAQLWILKLQVEVASLIEAQQIQLLGL